MKKIYLSLIFALFLTGFSFHAIAQNQVFEIVNTANPYEKINSFQGDFAHVGTANRDGIVDKDGREIIPCHLGTYSIVTLSLFDENRLPVKLKDKWGYYDTKGNVVIPFIYKQSSVFQEGYASVENENGKVTYESQGIIYETNLIGPFLVCKYGSKLLNKDGSIINISSTSILK